MSPQDLFFDLRVEQEVKATLGDGNEVQCIITRQTGDKDSRINHLGETGEPGERAFMLYSTTDMDSVRAYEITEEDNWRGRGDVRKLKVAEDDVVAK